MTVGNWKTHLIVECDTCKKPMGFHTEISPKLCNTCKRINPMAHIADTTAKFDRLLLAFDGAIASKGRHAGKLKSKCPPMGSDAAIMWQAMQMNANPYKVSIMQIALLNKEQTAFYSLCQAWADERKAIAPMLDRDRVALERLGAW